MIASLRQLLIQVDTPTFLDSLLQLSDYLNRKFQYYTSMRDGNAWPNPGGAIFGPKVMIVNEATASGGDALAYYFHSSRLGPVVGKRTWGGMIGTHFVPELIDGGQVTAPDLASWLPNGTWLLENAGISPDREVEFGSSSVEGWPPSAVGNGR